MTGPQESGYKQSQQGAWLSIVTYVALTVAKLSVGWWSGSRALLADGVNNLTDVISSVAILFGLRIAMRPADANHRYGHHKAETVAAIVVASIMGLVGLNVAIQSAQSISKTDLDAPHPLSLWVSLASGVIMVAVYAHNIRLAKRTGSQALAAAAYDNRSDALASAAAAIGVIGAQLGWHWLDPLAGLIVAMVIIRTAWHIGFDAAQHLTDGFEVSALQEIRNHVSNVDGVLRVIDVRARHIGNAVAVEVTIGVSPALTLVEAHGVSDRVETSLLDFMSIRHVHVHMEPVSVS